MKRSFNVTGPAIHRDITWSGSTTGWRRSEKIMLKAAVTLSLTEADNTERQLLWPHWKRR